MIFDYSDKAKDAQAAIAAFMAEHVYPNEAEILTQLDDGDRWQPVPLIEALKVKAKAQGLWNLFLPDSEHGAGLSNLDYAPACEEMGRSAFAPATSPAMCSQSTAARCARSAELAFRATS